MRRMGRRQRTVTVGPAIRGWATRLQRTPAYATMETSVACPERRSDLLFGTEVLTVFNQQRDQRRHIIGDRGTPTSKDVSLDPNNHLRCFHSVCHHATSASMAATISAGWMRR